MTNRHQEIIGTLLQACLPVERAAHILSRIDADPAIGVATGDVVSRATFAQALCAALFADLLDRVPSGRAYVEDRAAAGIPIRFDHGALRTIRLPAGPTGRLPAGTDAFHRILAPLGYAVAEVYPLPRLRMTGRAFRHLDHPETIPQFFVSELHVAAFDASFAAAAARVFGSSRDPLDSAALALLDQFGAAGQAPLDQAAASLPVIASAFACHHDAPNEDDYAILRGQSAEAAWIATEGNSFNHVTDRVDDVDAIAARQRAIGRRIKDRVEVSASGRVRQTAFRADDVSRPFRRADGSTIERTVPGSFYEFISRDVDPATGRVDLRFDSGNATGIFAMTTAAEA